MAATQEAFVAKCGLLWIARITGSIASSAGTKQHVRATNSVKLAGAIVHFPTKQDDSYEWLFAQRLTLDGQFGA